MRKKMKRRLGWVVLVGILVSAIIFFAIALTSARTKLAATRLELAEAQFFLNGAKKQEQIECFLRTSVAFYFDGKKKEAYRFLEYAIFKMADRDYRDLGMLPAKMLKDPVVAKKLRFAKLVKKGPSGKIRHFGGG